MIHSVGVDGRKEKADYVLSALSCFHEKVHKYVRNIIIAINSVIIASELLFEVVDADKSFLITYQYL